MATLYISNLLRVAKKPLVSRKTRGVAVSSQSHLKKFCIPKGEEVVTNTDIAEMLQYLEAFWC